MLSTERKVPNNQQRPCVPLISNAQLTRVGVFVPGSWLCSLTFAHIFSVVNMSARKDLKGRIVIYSIIGCPHCLAAKSSLQEHGLVFVDVSVDRFPPYVREWLKERTGGKSSVPQIFFNDRLIGGNEELQALMANKTEFEEAIK